MPRFHLEYPILESGDDVIVLMATLERPTLRQAIAEFFDECGTMLKHKSPTDFRIEEYTDDFQQSVVPVRLCPECLGNDEYCMLCGGDGVGPERIA